MAKYSDAASAGRSDISPFIVGEGTSRRHARRKRIGLEYADEVKTFCLQNDIEIAIKNEGHHWQLRFAGRVVEWWPSSAKMVVEKKWAKGKHVHDARQLIKELRRMKERYPSLKMEHK